MEIIKGTTRIVFVFQNIVIKIAIIHFYKFIIKLVKDFNNRFRIYKKFGFKEYLNHFNKLKIEKEKKEKEQKNIY